MASPSPANFDYTNRSDRGDYASGQSEGARSPLSMSLGFLKNLTERKSTRVDGSTPKRRGPKPDSKPALTRRQELNRQAQRTHRERKELYIKALEQEVLRLKENFSNVTQSKQSLAEENRQLKQLLAQHGIQWDGSGGFDDFTNTQSLGFRSSNSPPDSYVLASSSSFSPPPLSHSSNSNPNSMNYDTESPQTGGAKGFYNGNDRSMVQQQVQSVDYDQAGIDFVLTLERPCMDHMQFLVERSSDLDGEFFSGHALMATCPPESDMDMHPHIPFGHCMPHNRSHETDGTDGGPPKQKTWDLSKSDLANLLDLSKRLDLNGEITPVMAWGMVLAHPKFLELNEEDFKSMSAELLPKVRCYGFGAALEEFEVRDALEALFGAEPVHMSSI
ncbi:f05191d1-8dcb-41e6-9560-635c56a178fd [Sclerotinia trifoliorum]|uniref:F05191d1-8dcb-41e6-9560-635c56a178fd n=1 Tax=Sclerotinia trifoliorum TaxID=28548 RepID=A0A8H2W593_9HELO|nr:f05191d1-8dcb-41e6-9560-635c56a178fd [Sclerotinia trifoliorum]